MYRSLLNSTQLDVDISDLIIGGLTADRLIYSTSNEGLASATTTNNLTFSSGTLNTIQDIQTTSKPTFSGVELTDLSENKVVGTDSLKSLTTNITTDGLGEGITNKYYSTTLFNADFASKTTDDLKEGTAKFYTDTRARQAISGGSGISYNSSTGEISATSSFANLVKLRDVNLSDIYIGRNCGISADVNQRNIAIGENALNSIISSAITSNYNTAIGLGSLNKTDQSFNTALGYYAGSNNSNGYGSVYLGYHAGSGGATTGVLQNLNVCLGYNAGMSMGASSNNTLLGALTAANLTTGMSNVCLGYYAGSDLTTESGRLRIHNSSVSAGNHLIEGNFSSYTLDLNADTTIKSNRNLIASNWRTPNVAYDLTNGTDRLAYISNNVSNDVCIGYRSKALTSGNNNVAIGNDALFSNSSGFCNTVMGTLALRTATDPVGNTVIGWDAGKNINTASDNVLIGWGVCPSGSGSGGDAQSNVIIGAQAAPNGSGYRNVVIGRLACSSTGDANVMIGNEAGYWAGDTSTNRLVIHNSNSTQPLIDGSFSSRTLTLNGNLILPSTRTIQSDTFIVQDTSSAQLMRLRNLETADIYIGRNTGISTNLTRSNVFLGGGIAPGITDPGRQNVSIGGGSGFALTTGAENTFVGYLAGRLSTGDNNTFIGANSGFSNTGGSNCVYLGYNTYGTNESNKLRIGSAAGEIINGDFSTGNVNISGRIQDKTGFLMPPGTIISFAGPYANMPAGFLLCDGALVSRTTYADLFAAIGTAWGSGDGSTTYRLPDLLGRFMRGWSFGTARDPDRAGRTVSNSGGATGDNVGSLQGHQFAQHLHSIACKQENYAGGGGTNVHVDNGGGGTALTKSTGNNGGNETRPVNVYVLYIIKF
jgi:microcystin-dependent protein